MTAPYTQQNYADWKARFQQTSAVGGLLRQAKQVAGMEEEQAPPPMPQMLQPQPIPEAPLTEADTHEHRKGLLGKVRHFFGADRIAPEVSALLQPDQRKRLLNQGLLSQFIDGGEQKIARRMLDLGDEKKARDTAARQEGQWAQLQAIAGKIPDPQMRLEYVARMASSLGLSQGESAAAAVPRTRPEPVKILGPQSIAIDPSSGETRAEAPSDVEDVRDYLGGKAKFKNGVFSSWVLRPQSERDTTTGDALNAQREYQRVQGLRDDYANNPTIKRAADYASAYQGIVAAAAESNPQSNLAMMYEAVKMRDPNAVREGELALQRNARSVPGWMYGYWEKAAKGNVLTPVERQQIVEWARQKIVEQDKVVRPIQSEFGAAARRFGVQADSSFIAPSPFRGTGVVERQPAPPPRELKKTAMPKPANATDEEWVAFLLTRGEKP